MGGEDSWYRHEHIDDSDELVNDRPLIVERVRCFLCWIRMVLLAAFHLELGFAGSNAKFELVQNSAIGSRKVSVSFW